MNFPGQAAILLSGICFAVAAPVLNAQELDKDVVNRYERIGAFGGAAIGALAGGPAGAVVTAAVGGWVGDKLLTGKHNRLLKAELATTREALLALQETNAALQQEALLAHQTETGAKLLASSGNLATASMACCADTVLTLNFRTNSIELEPHYRRELADFVRTVSSMPDAVIEMTGHADRRGTSADNLALSQQRLRTVEAAMRELGLRNVAIETTALGDRQPLTKTDSFESNFFDRRVQLRVRSGNGELLSSNR